MKPKSTLLTIHAVAGYSFLSVKHFPNPSPVKHVDDNNVSGTAAAASWSCTTVWSL